MRSLGLARLLAAVGLIAAMSIPARADNADRKPLQYPKAEKVDQVDDYHGTKVSDPYRWLEDLDSKETKAWVDAENKVTFAFLDGIAARKTIKERLTTLWNYERYGVPVMRGGRYFFSRNDGLQNQSVQYWMSSLDGEPKLLLDPNKLSKDGTVALSGISYSDDGKYMAYSVSSGGSDWQEWKVRQVDTGEDLSDDLKWVKFSGASWTKDGKGFYYSRYAEPDDATMMTGANYFQKLYYHRIGTPQSEDALVYERKDHKEWGFSGGVTDDGRYLAITVWEGTDPKNRFFYKDLGDERSKVVELLDDFDASYDFVGNDGPVFWFRTDLDAPRGRVIAIDTREPARDNWKEIVEQGPDALVSANVVNHQLVLEYLKDAHSEVRIHGTLDDPGTS